MPSARWRCAWGVWVVALALWGCSDTPAGGADTAVVDTGGPDTGISDTGSADTGSADTGNPDTGSADVGATDGTSTPDAGATDTASTDAVASDATPSDATGAGPTDMAGLCAAIATHSCAPLGGCCKGQASRFDSEAACVTALTEACVKASATETQLVASGAATFDPTRAAQCAALYAAAAQACDVAGGPVTADVCKRVVVAKAAPGESCAAEADGLRCGKGGAALCFPTPTGVPCKAMATPGQACKDAPCGGVQGGVALLCLPAGSGADVCDLPRGAGGACKAAVHCDGGHWCKANVCVARSGAGAACSKAWHCAQGLHCGPVSQVCEPVAQAGGPCYQHTGCSDGLRCAGVTVGKVCMFGAPDQGTDGGPTLGQPCTGTCAKGLHCTDGPLAGSCVAAACVALGPTPGTP